MEKKTDPTQLSTPSKSNKSLSPFDDLRSHIQELEHRFENLLGGGFLRTPKFGWPEWAGFDSMKTEIPKVDIIDQKTNLLVRAEIPGMKKENIDISVSDTSITIKGHSEEESEEKEKENYYRRETSSKSFTRTLSLPCEVQSKDAKANFQDGMLQIILPKAEKAKAQTLRID
jgi:HSP20 family protein